MSELSVLSWGTEGLITPIFNPSLLLASPTQGFDAVHPSFKFCSPNQVALVGVSPAFRHQLLLGCWLGYLGPSAFPCQHSVDIFPSLLFFVPVGLLLR